MTADALISRLEAQGLHLTRRGGSIVITPGGAATSDIVELVRANKPELLAALPDAAGVETRHARLIAMFRENPTIRYAVITDSEATPDAVIVSIGIRGVATCDIQIPRERFDPFALLDITGRYSATIH